MKVIFPLALIITLISSCVTAKKIVKREYPSPFEFSVTDTVPGAKNELFVRAFEWISRSYGSAKSVVDMHDKEIGKIIGKAKMSISSFPGGTVSYIISIDVKDGRYRCIFSDFVHDGAESVGAYGRMRGVEYGNLSKDKFVRKMPDSGRKEEDKYLYQVKNLAMDEAILAITSLKDKMKSPDTW